jgi:NADPH:quinone reductase
MRVLRGNPGDGIEGLVMAEGTTPTPGPGEVLVRVHASAINRADLIQLLGFYPAPPDAPADIPGLEYAGEVIQVGANVSRVSVGARVMGLMSGGAWAEYLVVPERQCIAIPPRLSWAEAAAIPEAFLTAWDAMVLQAKLTAGESVLIHAAASGVGTAALQLAQWMGAHPIGTLRQSAKATELTKRGLPGQWVVSPDGQFVKAVTALNSRGFDVCIDLVGGDWLPTSIEAMAYRGRLILVGLVAGASAEVPLRLLLGKRLQLLGTTLRSRPAEEKAQLAREFERTVVPAFEAGKLGPVIDEVVSWQKTRDALERLSRNENVGKLVLTID